MKHAFLFLLLAVAAFAVEPSPSMPEAPKPYDEVTVYARTKGLPFGSLGVPRDRGPMPGDRAVLLISLVEKGEVQQWLLDLELHGLSVNEAKVAPSKAAKLYVNTGDELEFASMMIPLQVRLHGPFKERQRLDRVEFEEARVLVDAAQLGLGFDRAAATLIRLRDNAKRDGGIGFNSKSFTPEEIEIGRQMAADANLEQSDIRAFAATGPALMSFFNLANSVSGIKDIVWELIDKPSAWSVLRNGGAVEPFFDIGVAGISTAPARAKLPPVYVLPVKLSLNKKEAMHMTMLVTNPLPPLVTTAGILTAYFKHPTRDTYAFIQILGAEAPPEPR